MKSNKNVLIKKTSEYLKIVDDFIDTIYEEKENERRKKTACRSISDDWNPSQVDYFFSNKPYNHFGIF